MFPGVITTFGKPLARYSDKFVGFLSEGKLLQPAVARAVARPKQKRGPVPLSHPWRFFDYSENSMLAKERRGELCILRK